MNDNDVLEIIKAMNESIKILDDCVTTQNETLGVHLDMINERKLAYEVIRKDIDQIKTDIALIKETLKKGSRH